jgi:dCMP deaminase
MFVTHCPCLDCAKGIYQAGIKEVFYREDYRSNDGIDFLKKCGIKVEKVNAGDK